MTGLIDSVLVQCGLDRLDIESVRWRRVAYAVLFALATGNTYLAWLMVQNLVG